MASNRGSQSSTDEEIRDQRKRPLDLLVETLERLYRLAARVNALES